jgi:hypothetical protein
MSFLELAILSCIGALFVFVWISLIRAGAGSRAG